MTHTDNRARLTVDPAGSYRLYQAAPLPGWTFHGVVTRGIGDTGALGLSPAGRWCQVNAGSVRSLNQDKVAAALHGKVTNVRVTPSGIYGLAHRAGDRFEVLLDRAAPVWRAVNSGSTLRCDPDLWATLDAQRM